MKVFEDLLARPTLPVNTSLNKPFWFRLSGKKSHKNTHLINAPIYSKAYGPLYIPMIKDYFSFVQNPKKNSISIKHRNAFTTFISVLLITYVLVFFISFIPSNIAFNAKDIVTTRDSKNLFILLIIPLYEELLFRLGLKISALYISFSISLLISSIIINLIFFNDLDLPKFYLFSFMLALPFFLGFRNFVYSQKMEEILLKRYNYIFFSTIILFALSHFLYIEFDFSAFLTYLVYGYSLSFLRVTTQFFYCVILHFIFIAPVIFQII